MISYNISYNMKQYIIQKKMYSGLINSKCHIDLIFFYWFYFLVDLDMKDHIFKT